MTGRPKGDLLVVLGSRQRVMRLDKEAKLRGLAVDTIPAPRAVSSDCGVVLEARRADAAALGRALAALDLEPGHVFLRKDGEWRQTTLEAAAEHSAGSCGPPPAGDAVVAVEAIPEPLLVHNVDLLPSILDDPFTFGSLAAVHALSPVYARGGTPLSGLHLLCAPRDHDEGTLTEILRGGDTILERAGATATGRRRVAAPEQLYGLAVTGTASRGCTWSTAGARPGDLLVLTKPLGGSDLLAASRHDPVDPTHLRTALRWMSTLDQRAVEALRQATAHAVAALRDEGLLGHAAALASASGLEVTLELGRVPLLPGVRAATTPRQDDRRRPSVARPPHPSTELGEGCDPVLVELVTRPQVAGGLLAAVPPESADALMLGVTGAAVVGCCRRGQAGRVALIP